MRSYAMRIDSNVAICGELDLYRTLPPQFRALFAGADKDDAFTFADRCLGPFISHRGSFTFEKDAPHEWLQTADLRDAYYSSQAAAVRWAQRQLGSIALNRFALFYSEDKFTGFWIETNDRETVRILASRAKDDQFEGLPSDFEFTAHWIARAIIDLY